ncbi:MAG TPA: translation initiation factor IF-5A [Candidatus Nanoarchaeia archaeon]|nr:translation initiation factor IF-5A [Candidatus Nanoarchaeia archaeon]
MTTKFASASSMKEGSNIVIDGAACRVVSLQISRPGKHGHAKIRLEAVGLIDEKKRVIVMPGHDNVEVPIIEKKSAQVLSIANNVANVMDSETYETFDLAVPEELRGQITGGSNILYWQILGDKVMKQVKPSE